MEICEHQSEIGMRQLPAISKYGYVSGKNILALEWAWQTFLG